MPNPQEILAATLGAYIVCDVLLTPPAGLETRNPAKVTVAVIVIGSWVFRRGIAKEAS